MTKLSSELLARGKLPGLKEKHMKKDKVEMLPEYDFSVKKGVRGKYSKAYRAGHSVRILDENKVVSERYYASIEPDVREYFPDSKSINKALRTLISIFSGASDSMK